jgi:cytochrome b involved in lipid metabolism
MGWISVGLLIVSGGCILYKHPPTSIVQLLLLGYRRLGKEHTQQSQQVEDQIPHNDRQKKQESCQDQSPIPIPTLTLAKDEPPANRPQPSAMFDVPRPVPADVSRPEALTSSQSQIRAPPTLKPPTFSSMPPPPRPSSNAPLRPPPSAASSLRVPATKTFSNAAFAPSRLTAAPAKRSRQVTLTPGHSPLDWAALTSDPNNELRGKDAPSDKLIRVPPSQLQYQNGRKGRDAWTEYQGKVYNITPYLPFHPGGEGELMRGAGGNAVKLFMEVHPWVNWEAMLGECLVGIVVGEDEGQEEMTGDTGQLDEMD